MKKEEVRLTTWSNLTSTPLFSRTAAASTVFGGLRQKRVLILVWATRKTLSALTVGPPPPPPHRPPRRRSPVSPLPPSPGVPLLRLKLPWSLVCLGLPTELDILPQLYPPMVIHLPSHTGIMTPSEHHPLAFLLEENRKWNTISNYISFL